jgi:hypothetical protein
MKKVNISSENELTAHSPAPRCAQEERHWTPDRLEQMVHRLISLSTSNYNSFLPSTVFSVDFMLRMHMIRA